MPELQANAYLYLDHAYKVANNYSEATKNLIIGDRIAEKNDLLLIKASPYKAGVIIYDSYKQISEAIKTYKKYLELCEK